MKSNKYPQYKVSQWLDTSEEAMQQQMVNFKYGVQIKLEPSGIWMHVHNNGKPLIFESASGAMEQIKKEKQQ